MLNSKHLFRCIAISILLIFSQQLFQPLHCQQLDNYEQIIEKFARQYSIDKNLVKSIIKISSGGNSKAISSSGSIGLMQLTPEVIKNFGIKNPYDPAENIKGGCAYFKLLLAQFDNTELAIAAFNAGPEIVKKYGKIPPVRETQKFVSDVMSALESFDNSLVESNVYGNWKGTGKYLQYELIPKLENMKSLVGVSQPFDLEISSDGPGVSIKTSGKLLGNPSNYKIKLDKNSLSVEYSGPNPFGEQIPNTKTTHTMTFYLDVNVSGNVMKGEFRFKNATKMIFTTPNLNLPESNAEVNYTMQLNLKK